MSEKIYKTMTFSGSVNIVIGIVSIAIGVAIGVLSIINGANLLKKKSEITF